MIVFNKCTSGRAISREFLELGQVMTSPAKGAFPRSYTDWCNSDNSLRMRLFRIGFIVVVSILKILPT